MYPKIILLLIFTSLTSVVAAQDKIYTRKKGVIDAKVMEATRGRVIYRMADDLGGKDRVMDRDDIHKIEYADGREDYRVKPVGMGERAPRIVIKGNNILSMALFNIGDEGVGYGFAYERVLDKEAFASLYLPVNMVFGSPDNSGDLPNGISRTRRIFQFMPGLKIYPTRNNGKVRFAVGPQFIYENGEKYEEVESKVGPSTVYEVKYQHVEKIGILANSSLNVYAGQHIYMGADLGMGASLMHKLSGVPSGVTHLVQFNFRLGYRF